MNESPPPQEKGNLRAEAYIKDWNWDAESYKFALEMGVFLLQFIDRLHASDLSQTTIRQHEKNAYLIGAFECDYGDHDLFTPAIFTNGPPAFLFEFKRKVSSSQYAVASYKSTWRKIEKYVKDLEDGKLVVRDI